MEDPPACRRAWNGNVTITPPDAATCLLAAVAVKALEPSSGGYPSGAGPESRGGKIIRTRIIVGDTRGRLRYDAHRLRRSRRFSQNRGRLPPPRSQRDRGATVWPHRMVTAMNLHTQNNGSGRKPWLTSPALWLAIAAWAFLGVSGWLATAEGVLAGVLVGLTLACDVLAARLPVHAGQSGCRWRAGACIALALGCATFTGFSAKRGLELAQAQGGAPFEANQAERAELQAHRLRIEAELAAVPGLTPDIPAVRLRALAEARQAEIERLRGDLAGVQDRIDALPRVPEPPPPLPDAVVWPLVALIEGLKLLGFWAIGGPRAAPSAANPAQALAALRWRKAA